jgi:glycosyltransferase involved in cell wall biosynthesis
MKINAGVSSISSRLRALFVPSRTARSAPATVANRSSNESPTVRILGTHGVPAAYGGFETAAENVALYLRDAGWRVVVYCQVDSSRVWEEDEWRRIHRVMIPVQRDGWLGTSAFDLLSIRHASKHRDVCLTFGYNTAIFNTLQRFRRIPNVINMDGIEWSRARWGPMKQGILYANERIACVVGNRLIADHPRIEEYLARKAPRRKISTITYGAHSVLSAPVEPVRERGLVPGQYLTLICRPIPENLILELVRGFSAKRRGVALVIFGEYRSDDPYHQEVLAAASDEVRFVGAVYDPGEVAALRFHSCGYLHGHTVGGTNPSLVEAMAAGNPVVAHDNEYNRWVAGSGALYFRTSEEAATAIGELLENRELRSALSLASRKRHAEEFTWEHVAGQYDELLKQLLPPAERALLDGRSKHHGNGKDAEDD